MDFQYNNNLYEIKIIRKDNKNTYIRVKNGIILVTTNYFTTSKEIEKLIRNNEKSIIKMINIDNNKNIRNTIDKNNVSLFGNTYHINYGYNNFSIDNDNIYILDEKKLAKFMNKEIVFMFSNRLNYWYNLFEEEIPKPNLKIRKMTSRWGVCNLKNNNVTLNYDLSKFNSECLDYVIVHELSHFIYPNHSKDFWLLVSKYYPDYKKTRKVLKG